jgi:V/A-type H+-transporting ATPase subunit I
MRRVALVAAGDALRDVLVRVADAAAVELGPPAGETAAAAPAEGAAADGEAARRLRSSGHPAPGAAALAVARPDLDALERAGRYDLLAGEAQLEVYAVGAVRRSGGCALAGWMPADRVELGRAGAGRGAGGPRPRA